MGRVMALGCDWEGAPLFTPRDEVAVAASLIDGLDHSIDAVKSARRMLRDAGTFRGEVARAGKDPADPKQVGWTYLINASDPDRAALLDAIAPLARARGMAAPAAPLELTSADPDAWFDWLTDTYYAPTLEGGVAPGYVLILGGPEQVPFAFQTLLQTIACVGRLAFARVEHLRAYVDKLLRLEAAADPVVDREAIFFATDAGVQDPTYYSREYMATPLADCLRDELGFATRRLFAADATKAKLVAELATRRPALVYTASHGLGATSQPLDTQRRLNGAICCQRTGPLTPETLFSADDVPLDRPFLEGAVVFQFACYGYGTPARSEYAHWLDGAPASNSSVDFVAALPTRLLAHPRGPIAYVGHLDTAFLHGFADQDQPDIIDRWHGRIAPFRAALMHLLGVEPAGLSLEEMSARYNACNALITNVYDRIQAQRMQWTAASRQRFVDQWIIRGDAQNFMVMGDPAAHLRIPAP